MKSQTMIPSTGVMQTLHKVSIFPSQYGIPTAMSISTTHSPLSTFRELSKSGIVALVVISVLGGYLVGHPSEKPLAWGHLFLTLLGVLFLASGSSALNQIQERKIDTLMPRTAQRPLPSGRLSVLSASLFSAGTLALGLAFLSQISMGVLALGMSAIVFYNGFYTLWWKKHWAYAAVPGAIPGALPILMGFAAASGEIFHSAGLYLFFLLFYWQMPHFWVLALRFREDYEKGSFPTLPVSRGARITVMQITIWALAYIVLSLLAPLYLQVSKIYLAITLPTCVMVARQLFTFVKSEGGLHGAQSVAESTTVHSRAWLGFFLWVNFSLILFLAAAALDLWSHTLFAPLWTR